jgi:hypothetical protein
MKMEFDTFREKEIFSEILKDINISEIRPELSMEAHLLLGKMREELF